MTWILPAAVAVGLFTLQWYYDPFCIMFYPNPEHENNWVLNNVSSVGLYFSVSSYVDRLFNQWKTQFEITEITRRNECPMFYEKLKVIVEHNEDFKIRKSTFSMNWNANFCTSRLKNSVPQQPGDTIQSGTSASHNIDWQPNSENPRDITFTFYSRSRSIPKDWDWRKSKGVVPPVKDQGKCNASYAFSAVSGVAAHCQLHLRESDVKLSVQQVVDCAGLGCVEGDSTKAFQYIRDVGLVTEEAYKYVGRFQGCNNFFGTSELLERKEISGYGRVSQNEEALKQAVYCIGPITVTLATTNPYYVEYYFNGIYDLTEEPLSNQDEFKRDKYYFSALLVGYGEVVLNDDENNLFEERFILQYWIIQLPWSEAFGNEGHMYLEFGSNILEIQENGYFPTFGTELNYLNNCT